MFGLPVALLVKIAIGLAVAGIAFAGYKYADNRLEHHYADPVRAEWEADKQARIKRTTEITLELSGKLMEARDAQARAKTQLDARFSGLSARAAGLRGADVAVSGAAAGVFDDASRAANSARPDSAGQAGANPVPAAAETKGSVVYDERELAGWAVAAGNAYADAYGLWKACRNREDQYLVAMTKGANP